MARVGSNGSLGMGIAFVLEDYFTGTAEGIENAMGNLDASTERLARSAQNSFAMIVAGASMVATSIAGLSFFKKASDVRAEFESYEVQFETLLQSAERAQAFMAQIKQDAKDNPIFGTEALVAGNAALVATGNVSEETSRRITNNLAEILAGAGKGNEELMRMSANLQQIGNIGKATAVDIKQFGMAGIPIYKLLADSLGKTQEEIADMDVTLDQLDKAFAHATSSAGMFYGAEERARMSTKGLKAALEDNIELTLERIGKKIEPITRGLYLRLGELTDKILDFVETPAGERLIQWAFAGTALLGVMGSLLIAYGSSRLAVFKLAGMFGTVTKATILQTLATKGLTAGLREMAVAAWASLGPYIAIVAILAVVAVALYKTWDLISTGTETMAQFGVIIALILGPIGWLVAGIAGIKRGFEELKKPIDEMATSGVIGFFTKVAASIELVRQTWKTWDGENAFITEDLMNRLDELGIKDFAEGIISIVTRLKQFWNGFKEGLAPVSGIIKKLKESVTEDFWGMFNSIKQSAKNSLGYLKDALSPLLPIIKKVFDYLFGDMSNLSTWERVGKIVGTVLIKAFEYLVAILKVAFTILTWVFRFISGVVEFVYMMISGIITLGFKLMELQGNIIAWALGLFVKFEAWKTRLYQAGLGWIKSLKDGFLEGWGSFVSAISERLETLVTKIKNTMQGVWGFLKTGGGLWGNPEDPNPTSTPSGGNNSKLPVGGGIMLQSSKIPSVVNNNNVTNNSGGNPLLAPIQNNIILDGEVIYTSMRNRNNLNNSRND